jgi:hypothetical protein
MNRLKGHLVYLCGSMDQGVPDRGVGWREDIAPFLRDELKCGVLNPCDKPCDIGEEMLMVSERDRLFRKAKNFYGHDPVFAMEIELQLQKLMKPIIGIDLHMVDLSSFIILSIDTDYHACGTYSETTYALLERKPVLVVCKQGRYAVPPWLRGLIHPKLIMDDFNHLKFYLRTLNEENNPDTLGRWKFLDFDKIYSGLTFG